MERLFEWFVKLVLLLIFAPFLICLALSAVLGVLAAVLPWVIGLAVIAGLAAGVSAGLVLRRRLPLRNGSGRLPPGGAGFTGEPIRRPRGVRGKDQDG
ncbi:MAG: hypothetical protein ACRD1X_22300 [Vicinamibacteria bacterium]